jgi:hypothetical protein
MSPRPPRLPPPAQLETICKGLAALDAILCDDWECRCYSFDAKWDPAGRERMASMRSGSGDEWFLLFAGDLAFLKMFWHERPHQDPSAVYAGLPAALESQLSEPAFSMDEVTVGGWYDGVSWTLRGDTDPVSHELAMLTGSAELYCNHAREYLELEVPEDAVANVLAGMPLDEALLGKLGSTRTLTELAGDLEELGYGASAPA